MKYGKGDSQPYAEERPQQYTAFLLMGKTSMVWPANCCIKTNILQPQCVDLDFTRSARTVSVICWLSSARVVQEDASWGCWSASRRHSSHGERRYTLAGAGANVLLSCETILHMEKGKRKGMYILIFTFKTSRLPAQWPAFLMLGAINVSCRYSVTGGVVITL